MSQIDFLVFATGGGANVIDQPTYAAAPWVATGFPVSGTDKTAYSNALNKVWRQSSFWAALLANMVSAQLSKDVIDDGNLSGKLSDMVQAVSFVGFGAQIFTNIASAATTDLGTLENQAGVASHAAMITGSVGITSFGAAAANARPLYFVAFSGAPLLTNSANLILPGGANIQAAAGDFLIARSQGGGVWRVLLYAPVNPVAGALSVGAAGAAAGTQGSTGYERKPGGGIRQWTTIQLSDSNNTNWNLPLTFPTALTGIKSMNLSVAAGQNGSGQQQGIAVLATVPGAAPASLTLTLHNTGTIGTLCWQYIEAEGY